MKTGGDMNKAEMIRGLLKRQKEINAYMYLIANDEVYFIDDVVDDTVITQNQETMPADMFDKIYCQRPYPERGVQVIIL